MAPTVFGTITLITGPESLLAERAIERLRSAAVADEPECEVIEVTGAQLDAGSLAELTGGSLFATTTCAVITDLASLSPDLFDQVLALVADPAPELCLVLVHAGGNRGKGLLDKLKRARVEVVDCKPVKAWELPKFVQSEVRRAQGRIDEPAVAALVEAVGQDLRSLAAAVSQLLADAEQGRITEALVRQYFGGRAEVTSFAVADAALAGDTGEAMERLRWALGTGVAPVLVTSALASGMRALGQYVCLRGEGFNDVDLAREIGVPPWKLKSMRQQSRGWNQAGLAAALHVVAAADADVKGAAVDADFALERCLLAVAGHRIG